MTPYVLDDAIDSASVEAPVIAVYKYLPPFAQHNFLHIGIPCLMKKQREKKNLHDKHAPERMLYG